MREKNLTLQWVTGSAEIYRAWESCIYKYFKCLYLYILFKTFERNYQEESPVWAEEVISDMQEYWVPSVLVLV